MKKLFHFIAMALATSLAMADVPTVSVYADCSKNGYSNGFAEVLSSSGRTSCEYVQLWEGGPKWATFNIGATINDYAQLTVGADPTPFYNYTDQAPYYNTANVGGLYPWYNPNLNGRKTTWDKNDVSTGISDVATTLWGSNWKTPSFIQLIALLDNDTLWGYGDTIFGETTWTSCDGSKTQYVAGCTLKGVKISGVGDYAMNSIFLPVAGNFISNSGTIQDASDRGNYWANTLYWDATTWAESLSIPGPSQASFCMNGISVRAVLNEESSKNVNLTLCANSCGTANIITCSKGQQMRINAIDTYGYHFTQWNDGNTTNPRVVTMNSNATYTAQFDKNLYTISTTVNDPSRGIVIGDTTVEYLEIISISAIPNYGYHFTQWNDGNANNPRQIQVISDKTYTAQFNKNFYSITTIANSALGNVSGSYAASYLDEVTVSATANYGYHFSQWSDGNTDNPRSFVLTQDTTFEAQFAMNYDGKCGDNLYWQYGNGILNITGSGAMYNEKPWYLFADSISQVNLPNGLTTIGAGSFQYVSNLNSIVIPASVTSIGEYAFDGCTRLQSITIPNGVTSIGSSAFNGCTELTSITIPNSATSIGNAAFFGCSKLGSIIIGQSVTSIGGYAFKDCRKLYNIYCYAAEPPVAQTSSFENYNVYLRVSCDNLQDYQMDAVFGSFKYIECIGAEEIPVTSVTVVPNSNSVEITWPKNDQAANYTIEIKKDDVTFCALTFNTQGQLTSMAFAPGRGANNNVNAIEVANGYKFTITSLNSGTKYNYEIDTQNASGTSIANYTGTFTTTDPTALKQLSDSPIERFTKVINDGQLFILHNGKIYNAQGAMIE